MDKLIIDFTIKSTDSSQQFSTVGQLEGNTISFMDPSNESHTIQFMDDLVDYRKSGENELRFTFDSQTPTIGTYQTYQYQFEFTVLTTYLQIEHQHIEIQYQLYQEEELVNETSLNLYYEFAKEE